MHLSSASRIVPGRAFFSADPATTPRSTSQLPQSPRSYSQSQCPCRDISAIVTAAVAVDDNNILFQYLYTENPPAHHHLERIPAS